MQEEPLRKFSLPKIDVNCLHKIVTQSTVTFVNLLKEHNEAVRQARIINKPTCRGFSTSSASPHDPVTSAFEPVTDKMESDNAFETLQFSEPKSSEMNSQGVNGITKEKSLPTTALDLGWGSENDDDDDEELQIIETRPCPRRVSLQNETSPVPKIEEFSFLKSDTGCELSNGVESECNVKCDFLYSLFEAEEKFSDETPEPDEREGNVSESSGETDSNFNVKPIRCYQKKSLKYVGEKPKERESSKDGEPPFFVIARVVGNAKEVFSDDSQQKTASEPVVITPQKTTDITKIKGWRRKQFLVEKLTTVEFYSYERDSTKKKIRLDDIENETRDKEATNVENAFVCDSLDNFLDNEAELKINYEIPHLYAEVGIKLTSEDLVSKPNLTEEDVKEVGSRYCVELPPLEDNTVLPEDVPEKEGKEKKRSGEFEPKPVVYKMLKIDKNKRKLIEVEPKWDPGRIRVPKSVSILKSPQQRLQLTKANENSGEPEKNLAVPGPGLSLTSKLLGLVVYPGGPKPLHPIVQRHLHKLRSYRTKIDENWANFAASAVREKSYSRHLKRKILPVYCTGRIGKKQTHPPVEQEVKNVVNFLVESVTKVFPAEDSKQKKVESNDEISVGKIEEPNLAKKNPEPKECRVVLDKIITKNGLLKIWCMEHECYNCHLCGLDAANEPSSQDACDYDRMQVSKKRMHRIDSAENVRDIATDLCVVEVGGGTEDEDPILFPESSDLLPVITAQSLPNLFDQRLTNLLKQKLRDATFDDDILINIDKLKTFVPDCLELIKLNFIKQSFLNKTINLWYLKPAFDSVRSRAFLTFTKIPPEENAIIIERNQNIWNGLPKVITEIVSSDKVFDNDEYGILHCNGKMWEIHGSLKVGVDKSFPEMDDQSDMEVEQVVIPVPLPEMKEIRKIATQMLRVKATKWWVLDVSQKFSDVVLNLSTQRVIVSRKHLLSVIKSKLLGFLVIKKRKGRWYGLYIIDSMLPFVLIGPYYTFENCSVSLRADSKKIPFSYRAVRDVARDDSLKFFINSVITVVEENKCLGGLWLYDKKNLENACYLETLTTDLGIYPINDYSVEKEHDYASNSSPSQISQSCDSGETLKVPAYLYFDVFELGYVTGYFQSDNSILISHPLSPTTRIKSHHVGKVFVNLLKRRIKFIPKSFKIKWYITKDVEELKGRMPFNKYVLGGAHILCEHGLLPMVKLTDDKIKKLGLKKKEVVEAISASEIVHEVAALRHLKSLVTEDKKQHLTISEVLEMGIKIIEELKKTERELAELKSSVKERKFKLWEKYANLVNEKKEKDGEKVKDLFSVVRRKYKNQEVDEKVREILEKFEFGKMFVAYLKSQETGRKSESTNGKDLKEEGEGEEEIRKSSTKTWKKTDNKPTTKIKKKPKSADEGLMNRLQAKVSEVCKRLDGSDKTSLKGPKYKQLMKKLDDISSQINSIKSIFNENSEKLTEKRRKKPRLKETEKFRKKFKKGHEETKGNKEEREKVAAETEGKKSVGFIRLDTIMCSVGEESKAGGKRGKECADREEISHVKNKSESGTSNNSMNGNKTDKKFVIIQKGKNKVWSVQPLGKSSR